MLNVRERVKRNTKMVVFARLLIVALVMSLVQPLFIAPPHVSADTVLVSDGVYSFGEGWDGQLGHGDKTDRNRPKWINGLSDVVQVAGGGSHTLALTSSGEVYSFGDGGSGQLGHGDDEKYLPTPTKIAGISNVTAIAAGWYHSLALTVTGEVYSFGVGDSGRLGHVDSSNIFVPTPIEGLPKVTAIAAGGYHSLALTVTGEVYSFGFGYFGQLGHGDENSKFDPTPIKGLEKVTAIAAGSFHSLALTVTGEVYSFGSGGNGRLGHGDVNSKSVPTQIEGLSNVKAIAAGDSHSLLLDKDGKVYSFGSSEYGRLGHGDDKSKFSPTQIGGLENVTAIAAGVNHSLIIAPVVIRDSVISPSSIAIGEDPLYHDDIKIKLKLNGNDLKTISVGGTELEDTDYEVDDTHSTVTLKGTFLTALVTPQALGTDVVFNFSAGQPQIFRITVVKDSTPSGVYSFGSGEYGQLGHGGTSDMYTPLKILALSNIDIKSIAAGGYHSLLLDKDGHVYSFGYDEDGQLGHGGGEKYLPAPTKIAGISNITAVAAGMYHSLLLDKDGHVYSFGYGDDGQLGHGNDEDAYFKNEDGDRYLPVPTKIAGISNIIAIAAGGYHSLLLDKDGEVYSFGYGGNGRLGHGDENSKSVPTLITIDGNPKIVAISAGEEHSLLLDKDGEVYSFGYGDYGQLGHGDDADAYFEDEHGDRYLPVPTKIAGISNIIAIAAGGYHSLLLDDAGHVYSFGYGEDGRLGHGDNDNRTVPTSIMIDGSPKIVAIAAGGYHSLLLDKDGHVYSFGYGGDGQLGLGEGIVPTVPQQILGLTNVTTIAAGRYHSLVLSKPKNSSGGNNTGGNSNSGGGGASIGGGSTPTPKAPITTINGAITIPVGSAGETKLGDEAIIVIPSDAADEELTITIEKVKDIQSLERQGIAFASPVYELLKNITRNFKKPVTLSFVFDATKVQAGQTPAIYYYDEGKQEWVKIGGTVKGNTITADVDHFTKFAVLITGTADEETNTETTFTDIAGHWAEAIIWQAAQRGIVTGYADGTFLPNAAVTRIEFTKMLMEALEGTEGEVQLPFTDNAAIGSWAQHAVAQAVMTGIVTGYSDGTFRPHAPITRVELAVMIARAYGSQAVRVDTTGFADDEEIPAWAKGQILAIRESGIVKGIGNNRFAPHATATRAEAVTMIMNLLQVK